MKRNIWEIYVHKLSTDNNPQHGLCPPGKDSWCKFRKAEAVGGSYEHKNSLPEAVLEEIKSIFRDLSDSALLTKCLHGHTQNPNERFNNCIWVRIPKTVFVCLNTLKVGVLDSVVCFNYGSLKRLHVLEKLGINPGCNTTAALQEIDKELLQDSEKYVEYIANEARVRYRRYKRKREDEESANNDEYGAGMF